MRVLYDITTLGHIHCAAGINPTGIYNHTEAMGLALQRSESVNLSLCTSPTQYRKAIRYVREKSSFPLSQFALPGPTTNANSIALSSMAHTSTLDGGTIQAGVHEHYAKTYSPEAVYNAQSYDIYHVNWRGADVLPTNSSANIVLTIYDVIALKNPEWFVAEGEPNPLGDYLHNLLNSVKPRHAITVSTAAVKSDILMLFPHINDGQIFVTPLGVSERFQPCKDKNQIETVLEKYNVPRGARYVLCVNTIEPRKNMIAAIDAYFSMLENDSFRDVYLVLAGANGWLFEQISERATRQGHKNEKIIQTGYIEDDDLPVLYSGAAAFCYPSLDEGFGLPVLEAMRCGVPVITSNRPPLLEVVGDAALTVDPLYPDKIAQALMSVLSNDTLCEKLRSRGEKRARLYSWDRSADAMVDVYNKVSRNEHLPANAEPTKIKSGDQKMPSNSIANYTKTLKDQKGRFKGKRAFILGDGSSIESAALQLLGDEVTIATNKFFDRYQNISWKPDFYVVEQPELSDDLSHQLNGLTGSKFLFEASLRSNLRHGHDVSYFGRDEDASGSDVPDTDLTVTGPKSAINAAIQIAAFLGFDQIYLVGTNAAEEALGMIVPGKDLSAQMKHSEALVRKWHTENKSSFSTNNRKVFDTDVGPHERIYARMDLHELLASEVIEDCSRDQHISLDETQVISTMFPDDEQVQRTMIDVGAHRGHSAKHFVNRNWKIHCFEPDSDNREQHLRKKFGSRPNLTIDSRAVSDKPSAGVAFFTSEESSGISGLHAFRESHEQSNIVEVTTLRDVVDEYKIDRVDFLKIDVEGFDFSVLRGVPWERIKPAVIECEYEDYKTVPMGHTWQDIADYLRNLGYTVYVSEWHPIIRYGIAHDWRRVTVYPGIDVPSNSWGNLLAFLEDPGIDAVQRAFAKSMERHTPAQSPIPSPVQPPVIPAPKADVISEPSPSAKAPSTPPIEPPKKAPTDTSQSTESLVVTRPFYAKFGERVKARSPRIFGLLQLVRRGFVSVWKRPQFWAPAALAIAALVAFSLLPQASGARIEIWFATAVATLFLGLLYVAFRTYRNTATLTSQIHDLHAAQAQSKSELSLQSAARAEMFSTDLKKLNMSVLAIKAKDKNEAITEKLKSDIGLQLQDLRTGISKNEMATSKHLDDLETRIETTQLSLQNWLGRNSSEIEEKIAQMSGAFQARLSANENKYQQEQEALQSLISATEVMVERQKEELQTGVAELYNSVSEMQSNLEQQNMHANESLDHITRDTETKLEDVKSTLLGLTENRERFEQDWTEFREKIQQDFSTLQTQASDTAERQKSVLRRVHRTEFNAGLFSERLARSEQQTGQLMYPDSARVLVFFGHHKCGSRFFRNHVFSQIAQTTGSRVRRYEVIDPPFHYSRSDDLDMCNMDLAELGSDGREIVMYANASRRSHDKIKKSAGDDWKGLRIVRDPRQVLVSNYFHHKGDHIAESKEAGWVWDQLVSDKEILRELPIEAGLIHELENISKDVIENQLIARFDDPRILTLQLEEFHADPASHLIEIAEFLEVPAISGINLDATYKNPDSKPWRQVFTTKIRDLFKERYGQALIDMGYAVDLDW